MQGRGQTRDEMTTQEIERVQFKTNFLKRIDGSKLRECDNATVMKKETFNEGVPNVRNFF
jgi:ribonuclease PH